MPVEALESSCCRGVGITAETVKGWHRNTIPLEDQAVQLPLTVLCWDKVLEIIKLAFVD